MTEYTTISFKKEFLRDVKDHIEDQNFSTPKEYVKHLVMRDMESGERMSDEEIKEIGKKLENLGYLDR